MARSQETNAALAEYAQCAHQQQKAAEVLILRLAVRRIMLAMERQWQPLHIIQALRQRSGHCFD